MKAKTCPQLPRCLIGEHGRCPKPCEIRPLIESGKVFRGSELLKKRRGTA